MSANVGTVDRIVRAILGVGLLYLAFFSGVPQFEAAPLRYGAAALGIVMLAVAVTRVCPIYAVLGIRTCRA